MKRNFFLYAVPLLAAALTQPINASTFNFGFTGPNVSGTLSLNYGPATDSKTPSGYEVNTISGVFTDLNLGIVNQSITGIVPINHATPELTNTLAPNDFSKFAVASGLPADNNGFISFDNLLYPAGSPQTAFDYPFHGGFLDIYGLLFTLTGGDVVNLWSNGILPGTMLPDYGVAVVTRAAALDYTGGVVAMTPEPGTLVLLGTGLAGVIARRRLRA